MVAGKLVLRRRLIRWSWLLHVAAMVTFIAQPGAPAWAQNKVQARDLSQLIDGVSRIVFPQKASSDGITKALHYRAAGYHFTSEEEVNKYNIRSAHLIEDTARIVAPKTAPLESPY